MKQYHCITRSVLISYNNVLIFKAWKDSQQKKKDSAKQKREAAKKEQETTKKNDEDDDDDDDDVIEVKAILSYFKK